MTGEALKGARSLYPRSAMDSRWARDGLHAGQTWGIAPMASFGELPLLEGDARVEMQRSMGEKIMVI